MISDKKQRMLIFSLMVIVLTILFLGYNQLKTMKKDNDLDPGVSLFSLESEKCFKDNRIPYVKLEKYIVTGERYSRKAIAACT